MPAAAFPRFLSALHRLLATGLAALACAGVVHAASGSAQATLSVSVHVARHTSIRMSPPASITVTAEDARRGFVELQAPVEVVVQSNVQQGYTLMFEPRGDHVRQARVHAPDGEFLVGPAGVLRSRPATGRGMWRDELQLRFRFELAPGTGPGQYPWPLDISMMSA